MAYSMFLSSAALVFSLIPFRPQAVPALNIPDGSTIIMTARAEGALIYDSVADPTTASKLNWTYRGPEAVLYDGAHRRIGRLTRGPSFILDDATNISTDIRHLQSIPAQNPDSESWSSWPVTVSSLLGAFAGVTTVMRIDTTGGTPPKAGPSPDQRSVKSDFQATYIFLGTDPRDPAGQDRTIMATQIGNVDWGNITVAEALTSAAFFPGIPSYASPNLTARINIREKGMTFGQALRRIGEQAHAEVFVHDGKVYAVPKI